MRNLSDQLRDAIAREKLTTYQAAKIVGEETDVPTKVIHQRFRKYFKKLPQSIQQFVQACEALGYDVVLKKTDKYP